MVKIDPHEKTRENGRFREISPAFSSLLFFENEQKELLEKFCATEIELNGIPEREAFTAGFKIAMRLAAEAFYIADNE